LDPRQYFEIRQKNIAALQARTENPLNPYPHKFQTNASIPDFIAKYDSLELGQQMRDVPIMVAGRVHSARAAGKKLKFYDLHADGAKVQIHANAMYVILRKLFLFVKGR
jgi:lysyl-tRNA synthetase class 2